MIKHFLIPVIFFMLLSACGQDSITDKIVIVNIHNYDREGIARQIQNVKALSPKVIALDIQFSSRKDKFIDSLLRATLESCDNLVMASRMINYTHKDLDYQDTLGCDPYFLTNAKTGFVNAILEDDKFETLKRFSIKESVNGKTEYHFAVRTAMAFDSLRTMSFLNEKAKIIDVDYLKDQSRLKVISALDALEGNLKPDDIEGKIVLFGTFWIQEDDPDIFVSPLNESTEQYGPDMWGVVYLANIVAQVWSEVGQRITKARDELIQLGKKIVNCEGSESEIDKIIDLFDKNVPHPNGANLFYYPESYKARKFDITSYNPTIEEVVDKCLTYKPILL